MKQNKEEKGLLEFGTYVRRTFRKDGSKLFVKTYSDRLEVIFSTPISENEPEPDFWNDLTKLVQKYFKEN